MATTSILNSVKPDFHRSPNPSMIHIPPSLVRFSPPSSSIFAPGSDFIAGILTSAFIPSSTFLVVAFNFAPVTFPEVLETLSALASLYISRVHAQREDDAFT